MEVLNVDCLEYLKTCDAEVFDLCIADPPYFEVHGDFDFIWPTLGDYLEWCQQWIRECHRVLKSTGSFYLWGQIGYGNGFPLFKLADWIDQNDLFILQNWITQRNTRGYGSKKGYVAAREELLFFTKTKNYTWNPAYTEERSTRKDLGANGKPRKNEFKRCTDVWIDITEASQSSKQRFKLPDGASFPTVKALKLCERIINASSNKGDLVYIPFGGSGSEAVSCVELGRDFVLTEMEKSYIDNIVLPRLRKLDVWNSQTG